MNVSVLNPDHASTRQASEIDYAASMHFSAAYLPSGSSDSLDVEHDSANTSAVADHVLATPTHWSPTVHRVTARRL